MTVRRGRRLETDPLLLLIRAAKRRIRERATALWVSHMHRNKNARPRACSSGHVPGPGVTLFAHHDDYSRPLEIRWLCSTCHGRAHWNNPTDYYRNCWDEIARICDELAQSEAA